MKFSNNIIAAALFGFASQALASELNCYDEGWDIDISDGSMDDRISEFCDIGGSDSSPGSEPYDVKRSDGSDFKIELSASNVPDPDDCAGGLMEIISTCLDEVSEGDSKYFKGGTMYNGTEWGLSINCGQGSCPT